MQMSRQSMDVSLAEVVRCRIADEAQHVLIGSTWAGLHAQVYIVTSTSHPSFGLGPAEMAKTQPWPGRRFLQSPLSICVRGAPWLTIYARNHCLNSLENLPAGQFTNLFSPTKSLPLLPCLHTLLMWKFAAAADARGLRDRGKYAAAFNK